MDREVVAYLSHSLGSSNGKDTIHRHDNIANAGEWLQFLVDATSWIVLMPWYPYAIVLRELHRPRAFADQLRVLKRCDVLVLCGGVISPHMRFEITEAKRRQVAIVDLTDFGFHPPEDTAAAGAVLDQRLEDAVTIAKADTKGRPRRPSKG